MPTARLLQAVSSKWPKRTAAPFRLGNAAETLTKTVIPALAKKDCLPKKLRLLWLPGNLQKPLATVTFPPLEHQVTSYG